MSRILISLIIGASLVFSAVTVNAQTMPSQAQIEQFKKLPRAQQEMLARQYGFDLSLLDSQGLGTGENGANDEQPQTVFPRGTTFDEDGQPVIPEDVAAQFATDEGEPKPFGYGLFAGEPSTFAPVADAPVPSNYKIGVGDTVNVQLYGKESNLHTLIVDREGRISIPQLGPIGVAGLSYDDMRNLVQDQVENRMIGVEAAVTMGQMRSIQIFVIGEAYKPGAYTVSSLTTITQALFVSGGVSDIASLRNVQLKRNGETIETLDLYDFLINGNASGDRLLQSGDMVFIPSRGPMVTVQGEVVRPAIYELKGDETLDDAIQLAGGLLPTAFKKAVQVQRVKDGRRRMTTVNVTEEGDLSIGDGDNITVPEVSGQMTDSVMLVGAVARPGYYEWREGMRISDMLTSMDDSLLSYTDLAYGLIVREVDNRRSIRVHQFDVAGAIQGEATDLELQPRDQVVIFSRYENQELQDMQLSDWILTETDKNKQERERLLKDYRQNYLRGLVVEQRREILGENAEEGEEEMTARAELRDMFTQSRSVDEALEAGQIQEYSEYSRNNLLEPILNRLRNQFTESGNLPLVFVDGEVRYPGVYPLVENGTAADLVAAAGGLRESAYLARSEITRTKIVDGEATTDYVSFNLMDELMGNAEVMLSGRDRLNVFSIPEWQNTLEVVLEGEVRFPGTYAIRRGETLAKLVERAGGLTDYAFAKGALFTRDELKELERQRMRQLAQDLQRELATNNITGAGNVSLSYADTSRLLSDLTEVEPVGRMVIDLPDILTGSANADLQLKDGDRLFIPPRQNSINIIGEVQLASSYRFDADIGPYEYIRKAGGTKKKADEDRIFIVKANGSVTSLNGGGWFDFSNGPHLEPGDTIVVPLDTQYTDNMTLWADVTQILYQTGIAIAALNGL